MPITRINHFKAAAGKERALEDFLAGIISVVIASPGCLSVELLASTEAASRFAIVEVWESVEAHQSAARQIAPDRIAAVMPLLAGKPQGEYYRRC